VGKDFSLKEIERKWVKSWLNVDDITYASYNFNNIKMLLSSLLGRTSIDFITRKTGKEIIELINEDYQYLKNNKSVYMKKEYIDEQDYNMALDFLERILIECMKNMDNQMGLYL